MKLFLISFLSPFKIIFVFKKICSCLIIKTKFLQIKNIMLIVFIKKTEQLIKLKIAYFPPRHYKLKNTLIN
ncbi:hypothetical protein D9R21_06250 [Spiroplasma endosymbiont of Megaselia nigra]|nr:hypothetical protein D9R21_06250 [Spiroplasma endosymbiont of Megaselia nigra]